MIPFPRRENIDLELLHQEVDVLALGPYSIEWHEHEIRFKFDREPTESEAAALAAIVAAHDGTEAIAKRQEEAAKIAAIQAANKALVESARAKRLAGIALTQAELAALADSFLFPR